MGMRKEGNKWREDLLINRERETESRHREREYQNIKGESLRKKKEQERARKRKMETWWESTNDEKGIWERKKRDIKERKKLHEWER